MRLRMRASVAWLFAVALTVSAPRESGATVVVPLSREELTAQSDLVVRATVVSRRSGWNDDHSQIVTWTRLRVTEYLKGAGGVELVLRQFGGAVDGLESAVPGDARLSVGQHAVLFLRRGDGVVFLTALSQAAFLVTMGPDGVVLARRDLGGLTFARWIQGRMVAAEPSEESPEPLEQLQRSVRAIVTRRP